MLKKDLAAFHHGTIFATTKKPFVQAISQNFFSTFPGLTPTLINKHLKVKEPTAKGHMRQEQQRLQSTSKKKGKSSKVESTDNTAEFPRSDHLLVKQPFLDAFKPDPVSSSDIDIDLNPPSDSPNIKTNNILYTLLDNKEDSKEGKGYMDLTGRFPF